jgi:hypothetical protein
MALLKELYNESLEGGQNNRKSELSKQAIVNAVDAFKSSPTAANLAAVIKAFNSRPGTTPRIQGWKIV